MSCIAQLEGLKIVVMPPKPHNLAWVKEGYCPVSYWGDKPAHKGVAEAPAEYEGSTYLCTNPDVVKMFLDGPPSKFLPAFGAYCATALTAGKLAPVKPDVYKVVDGALYLFYDADAKAAFEADEAGMLAKAKAVWDAGSAK